MNRQILGLLVLCLMVVCSGRAVADMTRDEEEIRALAIRQAETWNSHDAKAYTGLFATDADLVNVVGWWWNGREEIERKLTAAYATMFKDSTLTITDVQVRFLTPQLAVAHVRWTMSGAKPPRGVPKPQQGIQTLVLQVHAGKWLIDVFQNTSAIPEVAFPGIPSDIKPPTG